MYPEALTVAKKIEFCYCAAWKWINLKKEVKQETPKSIDGFKDIVENTVKETYGYFL